MSETDCKVCRQSSAVELLSYTQEAQGIICSPRSGGTDSTRDGRRIRFEAGTARELNSEKGTTTSQEEAPGEPSRRATPFPTARECGNFTVGVPKSRRRQEGDQTPEFSSLWPTSREETQRSNGCFDLQFKEGDKSEAVRNAGGPSMRQRAPLCLLSGSRPEDTRSQECFKGSWATHKLLHKKAKDEKAKREVCSWTVEGDVNTDPWAGYRYTGKLRPHYPLMPTRPVPSYIQRPDYADHPLGMSESEQALKGTSQIKLLSTEDIEGMRLVCRLAREVLDIAAGMIKAGVTTEEIDHAVHLACIARNCYPSPLNYYNFPKSCCTSVNEV
ncbi:methionine aminopeptidase 1 isoform X4, partial [Cricetulus griseus]|uniref:methionine aminopeptidase 1 isoform X4 n=1 Tax=Cricetulus griseus TaxID=10029 RepID=UPI00022F6CDB